MELSPRDFDMINAFLAGSSRKQIADAQGISVAGLSARLSNAAVRDAIAARLETLGERVLTFKLDAFDAAEKSLAKLSDLSQNANTQELQRLASLDCVKISGLMPRKRVIIENNQFNGIDDDSREFIVGVLKELSG